jgi:ATP-binding cassette subfamily B protein/subfamily B ATP-binding cassette protein MsbA
LKSLLRVLTYIRPYWRLAALTFAAATTAAAIELLPPWLLKIIIDDVIGGNRAGLLPWVIAGLLGAHIGKNVASSLRIRFNNTLEQRVIYDLRDQVFTALQRLSISYYENRSTGEIMNRVNNDVEHVERIFIDGIESLLMSSLTLIGISAILFSLNWKLALLSLLPIPVLVFSASYFTGRVHKFYRGVRESSAELNAYLQDAISGIRETMGFNREAYERERFNQRSKTYSDSNLRVMTLWSMYSPSMIVVGSLGSVIILWYGTGEVLAGTLSVGELVAFVGYLALFYVPINQIHSVNHMLQHALAAGERVFEILDTAPDVADRPGVVRPAGRLRGDVAARHVSFHYRPDIPVLKDVNFEVRAGERIALVGPSGAGKSTLIKLLMRFYDVKDGAVMLDGRDLRDLPLAYVREQIGLVQQEPFLFNGTVKENIAYGDLSAGQARVEDVAQAARAHEFIVELPEKYDTWIGERGVKLSVGQKQRISIARVLLKDPPIIIFDEATSNIDTETEVKIREALEELTRNRTTFIIAHRLSTLRHVDRIVVLDGGRLVEEGTHETLLARSGLYRTLYDAQFQI